MGKVGIWGRLLITNYELRIPNSELLTELLYLNNIISTEQILLNIDFIYA